MLQSFASRLSICIYCNFGGWVLVYCLVTVKMAAENFSMNFPGYHHYYAAQPSPTASMVQVHNLDPSFSQCSTTVTRPSAAVTKKFLSGLLTQSIKSLYVAILISRRVLHRGYTTRGYQVSIWVQFDTKY